MTSKHDRRPVRMPGPVPIIEGYLADTLNPATVAGGVLTPATVEGYVFKLDASGNEVYADWDVTLTSRSESLEGERGYGFMAMWLHDRNVWRIFWLDCDATELTLPGD